MEAKLQRRIQRYGWDAAADIYERTWQDNLTPIHEQMIAMAGLRPGDNVLELACGSGMLTFRAAGLVAPGGMIEASDISIEMVELVQGRADAMGCDNVAVTRADAEFVDAGADSFDAALCGLGLMYMPDPVAALSAMYRALKPGGRAVLSIWGERRNCAWADMFPIVDSTVQSEVCPLFFNLGAGDNLAMAMQRAGFERPLIHRIDATLGFYDRTDTVEAMIDGGAVALAAKRFDAATRAHVEQAFLDSITAHARPNGGYDIPSEFVVAVGTKT